MKKLVSRLVLAVALFCASATAFAQFSAGQLLTAAALNAALASPTITGGSITNAPISGSFGVFTSVAATGGTAPVATNSAVQLWQSGGVVGSFVDSSRTANNRIVDWAWTGGQLVGRFVNDSYNAASSWITVSGGQGTGITGITSNSGSGPWTHTGAFQSTGLTLSNTQNAATRLVINNQSSGASSLVGIDLEAYGGGWQIDVPQNASFANSMLFKFGGAQVASLSNVGTLAVAGGLVLPITTVSALPACAAGAKGLMYAVSDATSPAYNGAVTGGGAVSVPVYCNGSSWTAH